MRKLFSLLKKDAIIASRRRKSTLLMVLLPAVLFVAPAWIIDENVLLTYNTQQLVAKLGKNMTGTTLPIFTPFPNYAIHATHCGYGNATNVTLELYSPRGSEGSKNYFKKVRTSVQKCRPVGGVFTSRNGVKAIVPATFDQLEQLKKRRSSNPLQYSPTLYNHVALGLYQMALIKFYRKFRTYSKPELGKDEIQTFFIFENESELLLMFPKIATLIGGCMTFAVIGVVKAMVVEREAIQPYLRTMGLDTITFNGAHFLFALIKCCVTMIPATICHCIWYTHFNAFWLLLAVFFFITASISFGLAISRIIRNPSHVAVVVCILWFGMLILTYWIPITKGPLQVLGVLNPHWALQSFFLSIEPYFCQENGMKFLDGFSSARNDQFPSIFYIILLILSTVIFGALSLCPLKLCSFRSILNSQKEPEESSNCSPLAEEHCEWRSSAPCDIELVNLSKTYKGGQKAVKGLSLRALRGQISVLLGHNGSGKSSTFGMITGMLEPTSGRVLMVEKAGYCPQTNPLYEELTVLEHLKLVWDLKGFESSESSETNSWLEDEAIPMLQHIDLIQKLNTPSKFLSGGQKRKLLVIMAMLRSKVILLDEPTAGMDPGARCDVQEMLRELKTTLLFQEKSILLTTHYMDEAEKLGDWFWILSNGELASSGSCEFLKKRFGSGMVVTVVLEHLEHVEGVLNICKIHYPESFLKDQRGQMLLIQIGLSSKKEPLIALLEHLEDSKSSITALGVSECSLEQVFIEINEQFEAINAPKAQKEKDQQMLKLEELYQAKLSLDENENEETSSSLRIMIFALFYKRVLNLKSNLLHQILLQFIIPIIIIMYIIIIQKPFPPEQPETWSYRKNFEMGNFSKFVKVAVQFEQPNSSLALGAFEYLRKFENLNVIEAPMGWGIRDFARKSKNLELGLIIRIYQNRTMIFYKETAPKDLLIALNLLINLKYLRNNQSVGKETITMHVYGVEGIQDTKEVFNDAILVFTTVFLCLMLNIGAASNFLIDERISKFLHQQMLTGISVTVLWMSSVFFDFLMYMMLVGFCLLIFALTGTFQDYFWLVIIIFLLFFLSFTSFVYLSSLFSKSKDSSFLIYVAVLSSFIQLSVLVFMVETPPLSRMAVRIKKMYPFGIILPGLVPSMALTKVLFSEDKHQKRMKMSRRIFFAEIFEPMGIFLDVSYLIMLTVLIAGIFIAYKSAGIQKMLNGGGNAYPTLRRKKPLPITRKSENRVPILEVKDLVKDFENMRAVNGLSFSVHKAECFGFLGQNGAGKTTTFDMLTGLTTPSGGSATVCGEEISERVEIGYCPQFDAVMSQFTVNQVLLIMTCLHGYSNPSKIVETTLICIGMSEHRHKKIKNCSGGQKRKVSVGIALLSRSKCMMLDEPTAGIDPRERREIWNVLHFQRARAQCSIVLTSHSMEECEAVCSSIGVLRNGELVAMGSSQELKSIHGDFYLIRLVLREHEQKEQVHLEVLRVWSSAHLEHQMSTKILKFKIAKKEQKWSMVYKEVKKLAGKFELVDYIVTQATLEDVFLKLNDS